MLKNISPSVESESPVAQTGTVQQAPRVEQDIMKPTTLAELPEITGTEKTKERTGILSDITIISKQIHNVKNYAAHLNQEVRIFNESPDFKKNILASGISSRMSSELDECNKISALVNAKNFHDMLTQLFSDYNHTPLLTETYLACLKYKFGDQLNEIRNLKKRQSLTTGDGNDAYTLRNSQSELHITLNGQKIGQDKVNILMALSENILANGPVSVKNDDDVEAIKNSINKEIKELNASKAKFSTSLMAGLQAYYKNSVSDIQKYLKEVIVRFDKIRQESGQTLETDSIESEIVYINSALKRLNEQIELIYP